MAFGEERNSIVRRLLRAARGEEPAEWRLTGAQVFDTFSGEFKETDLYLHQGRILGFEAREALQTIDLSGRYLLPGFIDAHLHLESSYLVPQELARVLLPRGTTTVVCDPHEIANVLGLEGVYYLLREAERTPLSVFFTAPSCVPASGLETPAQVLDVDQVAELLRDPKVLGLAEVMNFPGVIRGEPEVLAKIQAAQILNKKIDGHAPGISGLSLETYRLLGPASDHECLTLEEAQEKLSRGFTIFIRRGTVANNLPALLPLVRAERFVSFCFCSDDLSPSEIRIHGHMDRILREAVASGLDAITAIRLATFSPALFFGLGDRGALFPGARADLVTVKDLKEFQVQEVFSRGKLVACQGKSLFTAGSPTPAPAHPVRLPARLDLRLPIRGSKIRVIGLVPHQIVTEELIIRPSVRNGEAVADPSRDLAKIVCVERHRGTGNYTVGFVRGFGLKTGALASTVAHDSHHLLLVGIEETDLLLAAERVRTLGGGQVVVKEGKVLAELPLPIAGLLSPLPYEEVVERLLRVREAAKELGCTLPDPFMSLSFLALPVIPKLKITDLGLVDVEKFTFVDLFVP